MKTLSKFAVATLVAATSFVAVNATEIGGVTVNGQSQFRLRLNSDMKKVGDKDTTITYYENKIEWHLKLEKEVHENLALKFKMGNPDADNMSTVDDDGLNQDGQNFIGVQRAEAIYTNEGFTLATGILEVKSTQGNSLLGYAENGGYTGKITSDENWYDFTLESQTGLKVGYDFGAAAANLVYSVGGPADHAKSDLEVTGHRILLDAPIKAGEATIAPSVALNTNANGGAKDEVKEVLDADGDVVTEAVDKKQLGLGAGIDYAQKFGSLKLKAGVGYGMLDKESGILVSVSPEYKLPTGKVKGAISWGTGSNSDVDKSGMNVIFADARYEHNLTKNFAIAPRVRFWMNNYNDSDKDGSTRIRPELIFKGKF